MRKRLLSNYEKNEAVENFDHLNCLNYTFAVVKIKHKVVRKGDK